MAYILDLFTPETWLAFRENGATVTGFRERHRRLASERVSQGDVFLCYLTRLSRWCGVLQAETEAYHDDSPLLDDPDPFTVRFKVKPIVLLDPESAIPIYDDKVWNKLTVTKQHKKGTSSWTGFFRGSLNIIEEEDGAYLVSLLERQQSKPESYPLTERDKRQLARKRKISSLDRQVEVEVPDDEEEESLDGLQGGFGARVAQIGAEMGFRIWVPRNDRSRVLELVPRCTYFLVTFTLFYPVIDPSREPQPHDTVYPLRSPSVGLRLPRTPNFSRQVHIACALNASVSSSVHILLGNLHSVLSSHRSVPRATGCCSPSSFSVGLRLPRTPNFSRHHIACALNASVSSSKHCSVE